MNKYKDKNLLSFLPKETATIIYPYRKKKSINCKYCNKLLISPIHKAWGFHPMCESE